MVAVPADGSGDVQGYLREESEERRNLVTYHLCGVIVAVVHEGDALALVHRRIAQGKLCTAHGVGLHADAEHLAFYAGLHEVKIVRLGENFVDGLFIAHSRPHPVGGDVLKAVPRPDVHDTGLPQLLGKILGNADAGFAVVDPEPAGFLTGAGQGQRVAFGVGEEGRVKVAAQPPIPAEVHPFLKVLRLQPVPVGPLTVLKDGVAGMKIQLFPAGAELQNLIQIRHQLLGVSRPPGVVAGGLDAAGKGLSGVGVKAPDVVPLPAVQGNGDGFQRFHGFVHIDADVLIAFFCFLVSHVYSSSCIFRLPRAVASMGRATTCLPVASSVRRLRNAFFAPPPTI